MKNYAQYKYRTIKKLKDEYRVMIERVTKYDDQFAHLRIQSIKKTLSEFGVDENWYLKEIDETN